MTAPLVSIITVVFNAALELPPLLESIAANRGADTELVVIDGGSNDGTIDVLRRFDDEIDYWLSEPDRGIYDAMNKGIALAKGEFILHLNAGDRLVYMPSQILSNCVETGVDVACFTVMMEGWGEFRPRTGFLLRLDNVWHHQGTFYRRRNHPGYDLQYKIFSDFDCNQKMMKAHRRVRLFPEVVAEQASLGVSASAGADEKYRIVRANFGVFHLVLAVIWSKTAWLRSLLKRALNFYESHLVLNR